MAGVGNNLYPPIMPSYQPAFLRTGPCKIYFSLSSYNTLDEIKADCGGQVIISYQNSNQSALDPNKYTSSIKLTSVKHDTDIIGDNQYYVEIDPSDLQDEFEIGEYYKVQVRFTGDNATSPPGDGKIATWLVDNEPYFSEWSTVCLIRGIATPTIYLKGLDMTGEATTTLTSQVIRLVGELTYDDDSEDEFLKSYEVNVYNSSVKSAESLIYQSGIVYTNEFYPNEINYTLKYNFEDGLIYYLDFIYITNNGYTSTVDTSFTIITGGAEVLDATISAETDEQNGRIIIHIEGKDTSDFFGNICIRRSSMATNFTVWEDIHLDTLDGGRLDYTWYDYTVQSGVYYDYCACQVDEEGERGPIIRMRYPIMLYLDDIFLTRGDFQLKVRFNPSISSFKVNLSESKTDTIGSRYPYFRRNGNVAYRTFPLSGLITAFCDDGSLYTSREGFYGDLIDNYNKFNEENQITGHKDFIYEKFFRDKIMDFLYSNTVKLYRSLTEGNILVKLMDISFTPNATLGRMLYTFSATAYEIDECTIDNYFKYGISTLGEYTNYFEDTYSSRGQIGATTIEEGVDVLSLIQDRYDNISTDSAGNVVNYLSWVRIEFESPPYLIQCGSDGSLTILPDGQEVDDNTVSGYIVYINGEAVLVSARGYIEYNDEDTQITSIVFPIDTTVTIDYTAEITESQKTTTKEVSDVSRLSQSTKVGQVWGMFDVNDSISKQLYIKYYEDYPTYYQKLLSINRMSIEAPPGTVIYVKDSFDDDYYRHEVGRTGTLSLYDSDAVIMSAYFCGVQLYEMPDYSRPEPHEYEFRDTGITVDTVDEITDPIKNGVYTINNYAATALKVAEESDQYTKMLQEMILDSDNRYIYYHGFWYVFTSDNVVMCPVEGLIDYVFELIKGEY